MASNSFENSSQGNSLQRLSIILYLFYLGIGVIVLRFFYLQIWNGEEFRQRSLGNTEREFSISAPRGLIYDRYGRLLAKNTTAFGLSLTGGYVPKAQDIRDILFSRIGKEINVDPLVLEKKYRENRRNYTPILIKENLSRQEVIYFSEFKNNYPFLTISVYSGRDYPYGAALAPVLGYTAAIGSKEYKELKDKGYLPDSIIGKSGIEKEYDGILRGINGKDVHITDNLGRNIQNLPRKDTEPISGKNIVLSIDAELQDIVYHAFKGRRGAVIVTKVNTGEVIALVSAPSYDVNNFTDTGSKNKVFSELLNDPNKPFLNRVIQGQYSPGSIFKILISLAALEDGKLDPYKVEDTHLGYFRLGKQIFRDHGVKASADLPAALEKSNNVYFYRLAYALGYSSILDYATRIKLRGKTGIDLPNELASFVPTPEWKENRFHEIWVDGDTVNIGIGQGFLSLTPIGIHNIISMIAADKLYQPRLLWEIQNPYTEGIEKKFQPILASPFSARQSTLNPIREGLMRVPYTGTGIYHKYLSKVKIAGKTGTAQRGDGTDNALFTSYGPIDAPIEDQYAVTVVVESAGYGAGVVPISSEIYNYLTGAQTKQEAIATLDRVLPAIKHMKEED